jgi:hypothetical protein
VFGWVFYPGLRFGLAAALALGYGLSTAPRLFCQCSFLPEAKVSGIKAPKARKNTAPGRHSTKTQALKERQKIGSVKVNLLQTLRNLLPYFAKLTLPEISPEKRTVCGRSP